MHQNVYIGRSRHAEHEYDIRFALGQTVWPLEAIKVSENGVPHSVFVYRPNRFKMHHTTCRDPGQVDTQQKTGFKYVKVKGQGQIREKTPILGRGTAQRLRLPAESFQNAPHDVPWRYGFLLSVHLAGVTARRVVHFETIRPVNEDAVRYPVLK